MYLCLGKACSFDIFQEVDWQQGQSGLMVMTLGFHPGDPGSIPLVGDFFLIFIHMYFQSSAQ